MIKKCMPRTTGAAYRSLCRNIYSDGAIFSNGKVNENEIFYCTLNDSIRMTSRKVLIIDDEKDLCHLMKFFLSQMEYEVFTSNTLHEGLQMVSDVTPDILFIDNNLPDGLGWEAVSEVRSAAPGCRIILISAYKVAQEKSNVGKVEILEKPISLIKLQHALG
jgi:DNA-binding NtrC family response regulator